ncbi:FliI/YscN family ATPase [Geobacter sulfurreducens]|jgi:flagellum-specific ATP synthase|uniref:Flagellum-specific ATPase FliI n=1 Tax=Geobacter sulfurreducens (strain ATCC 51573 / DSM 12127 / PCA) TaxID=243231 RepID=Q74G36_GEOSL|nr:FliI/YscN family ATPase [Geobacter sulfurreducens]AAR33745.1 flagellum-specific ATPase FliI [Geobacter sulfurreducens PCA]AJY70137.1 ATP synthase [Geobacter sulfurreducens]QVW35670.1 FliI/YscN family ATPase [Geobacter sulfurreducens]UAC04494.1 FliI/YscN family ATPase [Geobacter sulfurreducens]HBB69956.1 FliI/YscN family ATPase [Geobacter sulfurreducens]
MSRIDLSRYLSAVDAMKPIRFHGKVTQVVGLVIEGFCPDAAVGTLCLVHPNDGDPIPAEVVGFRDNKTLLMPLGELRGVGLGSLISVKRKKASLGVGPGLLGRVIDGLGVPIDDKGPLAIREEYPIYANPVNPMKRRPIRQPLDLGIRAINALLTCGEGQRVGIMAGSGVGKSTLLGMIARYTEADVNVIALIGERGRELREFIEKDLQEEGLKKSVVVVATSDQPPLVRMRGAYIATTIAEYFQAQGKKVLLMMDSATRFAMAMREVGLAIGEPPTTKGYTPSVFAALPKLLERTGSFLDGSITGLYTVLVEGDDFNEPISDAMRSILDGHIVLNRELAARAIYPPLDILASASRVMNDVTERSQQQFASRFKELLAAYRQAEDLINIGAYKPGSNPTIDYAIAKMDGMINFIRQGIHDGVSMEQSIAELADIFDEGMAL